MNIISAEQVKEIIENDSEIKLIMVLSKEAFTKAHIPGSINISDIENAKHSLELQEKIIVYCSDINCVASYYAYQQLEQAGYKNIWRFAGGLKEWEDAGFELVSI